METALADPRKTVVGEFSVSTALFPSRFETRVFSDTDSEIPTSLEIAVREAEFATADVYFAAEGAAIESYGFNDARTIHGEVVEIVKDFLSKHTRTVIYTLND